mgnify:CR=1 FL=1
MGKYIMALDQGTTSSRTILFDKKGNIVCQANKEFEQIFPKPGWVEHDPRQIWATQSSTLTEALASVGISSDEMPLALLISEKQRLYGTRIRENLFIMPLFGSVEELLIL